jgi:hypothetical protein
MEAFERIVLEPKFPYSYIALKSSWKKVLDIVIGKV